MNSCSVSASCAPALYGFATLCAALLFPDTLRATVTDADGDGIPATWESTYSGSPASMSDSDPFDASEDPDGDFLTNLGEYLAGTNPTDADSDDDGMSDLYNLGLEGYWRFAESAGAPASAANSVSGGPALTLNGATVVTGGLFGNALKPTSYYQSVNAAAGMFNGVMEWSFSGWFQMDSLQSSGIIFAAKANSSSTNVIGAQFSSSSWGAMMLYVTLAGSSYATVVNVASGSGYHHLAISRDQSTNRVEVYFDGSLANLHTIVTSSPEPLTLASGELKVSTSPVSGYPGYHDYFYGSLDDVRLYSRRLQATEVEALYNHGNSSSNAAKYWTLAYLLNNPLGQADSDSDGYTNLAEVIAGSDPQSSGSKPVPASTGYQLHTKLG